MKAAVFDQPGGSEVLRYADVADPVIGDDQLLVRVEAVSIEGGDLIRRRTRQFAPGHVIGYAAAGEVIAAGASAGRFKPGQKVATFDFQGSHAALRAVPAATSWLVPDGLDMGIAAAIPCGPGTAALALRLANVRAGQSVLVLGAAGGVGVATLQLAKHAGARVLGAGRNPDTLRQLSEFGLDHAVLAGSRPMKEQMEELLDGNGVDAVIDNVGGPQLLDAIEALSDGGCAVLVGTVGGPDEAISGRQLLFHRKSVIGCLLGPVMSDPTNYEMIDELLRRAARGELMVPISERFRLADAAAAHRRAEKGGEIGRVIMVP